MDRAEVPVNTSATRASGRFRTGRVPYQAGLAAQSLAHPHAAGDLRLPQRVPEETVLPERLYGFKARPEHCRTVTLTQKTDRGLDQIEVRMPCETGLLGAITASTWAIWQHSPPAPDLNRRSVAVYRIV